MAGKPTVILGAGLAGMAAAWQLQKSGRPYVLLEREDRPGGLARSQKVGSYTFDFTGHLLHLARPVIRHMVLQELGLKNRLATLQRRAFIYSKGVYTPYPFQANTFGLPPDVVAECLLGFIEARLRPAKNTQKTFENWIVATFGEGIAKHFMRPYNTKLWGLPPSRLTTEWMGRFVPQPSLQEVVRGALGRPAEGMGYNASFLYPKRGGIQILADALAGKVKTRLNQETARLDLQKRRLRLKSGEEIEYGRLITTLPLKGLLKLAARLPSAVARAGGNLRSTHVLNVNLGVQGRRVADKHWVYVPEPEFPFYRAGFYHNLSGDLAPRGCSGIYTEFSYQGPPRSSEEMHIAAQQARQGLVRMGLLSAKDRVEVEHVADLRDAYVVYDSQRTPCVNLIQKHLASHGVFSIGRWGNWEYSSMEDALAQGMEAGKMAARG